MRVAFLSMFLGLFSVVGFAETVMVEGHGSVTSAEGYGKYTQKDLLAAQKIATENARRTCEKKDGALGYLQGQWDVDAYTSPHMDEWTFVNVKGTFECLLQGEEKALQVPPSPMPWCWSDSNQYGNYVKGNFQFSLYLNNDSLDKFELFRVMNAIQNFKLLQFSGWDQVGDGEQYIGSASARHLLEKMDEDQLIEAVEMELAPLIKKGWLHVGCEYTVP